MTETTVAAESSFSLTDLTSDLIDGASAIVFLKDDVVLDNAGKRVGAAIPPFIGGMITQGALTRKGLRAIKVEEANKVIEATPLGKLSIRSL